MSGDGDLAELRERRRKFRRTLHATARRLREIELEVYDLMVALALATGPLARWAAEQEVGTIARFDDARLMATQDERVIALVQLRAEIHKTVEALYATEEM